MSGTVGQEGPGAAEVPVTPRGPPVAQSNKGRQARLRRVEFEMLARLLVPHTGAQSVPLRTSARTPLVAAALAAAVLATGTGSASPLASVSASGAAAGVAAGS